MEVPASLSRLRVPSNEEPRPINGTELALATLIYSHARADHATPVCTRPMADVVAMLGRAAAKVRAASAAIAAAGYWRRVRVGNVWRWEILIRPSDAGHRWADIATATNREQPQSGAVPIGSSPNREHTTAPDWARSGATNRGDQHQQLIREEAAATATNREQPQSGAVDPRIVLADAINAQSERAAAAIAANPPRRMEPGSAITPEHAAIREAFDATIARWPQGSQERSRLAACRPATPMPQILARAIQDLGGLSDVVAVMAWAWSDVAAGRLTQVGRVEAAQALRDAFRGEGRLWVGLVDAHARRPSEQRMLAWSPPDLGDYEPATEEDLVMPAHWGARSA